MDLPSSIDGAMVLFKAAHAESMMEHETLFTHSDLAYERVVRVPMRLLRPWVRSGRRGVPFNGIGVSQEYAASATRMELEQLRALGHFE